MRTLGQPSYSARSMVSTGDSLMRDAVIVEAVRTPIGKRGGALKDWRPDDLAAFTLRALVDRAGVEPKLLEKYEIVQQGISADLVADKYGVTREQMDEFSLWSHRKAIRAIDEGRFKREIEPVPVLDENGSKRMFDTDEHPRRNTSLEKLASLPPAFKADGRITAGNSSGINDGACALLVTNPDAAKRLKLEPRARVVSTGVAGTNPTIMLDGTIPAIRKALARADLKADDIDLWEVNEAFRSEEHT